MFDLTIVTIIANILKYINRKYITFDSLYFMFDIQYNIIEFIQRILYCKINTFTVD